MNIRRLTQNDYEAFCRISAASYIWKLDFKEESFPQVPLYGAFDENGVLCGELEANEFSANYCGSFLPVLGIGGVATMPEKRRMGSIRYLFDEMECLADERGWAMGFLYPFSIEYYRKFGYARVTRKASVTVPFKSLSRFARNCDVELYEGQCLEGLLEVHNEAAVHLNLMPKRSDSRFFCKEPLKECSYTYLWKYSDGRPGSYASFIINREVGTMVVKAVFWRDREAMNGIIGFLRNYDGVVNKLCFETLPIDSELITVLEEIDGTELSLSNSASGRIYNLPLLLEKNLYPTEHGAFRLKCEDTIEKNNGVFEVEYQNGEAAVKKISSDKFDISLDCCAAAKLLLSGAGFTAHSASFIDGVELCGDADGFFRAFPKRSTHFQEGF